MRDESVNGWHLAVLLVAGLAAGAVNAIAGGGTLLTFPALLAAGLSPVSANVTNTVALWPGYLSTTATFRGQWQHRRLEVELSLAAVVGAIVGTIVLLTTPGRVFRQLVPYLVLGSVALIALQPRLSRLMAARRTTSDEPERPARWLPLAMAATAVYGSYFGGGLGIVMLAVLALAIPMPLIRLNALKASLQLVVNTIALIGFAAFGPVDWAAAVVVAPASLIGGVLGARVAQRLNARTLRTAVIVFGLGVGLALLLKS